jgi:type VI protein secretion system component Hcp
MRRTSASLTAAAVALATISAPAGAGSTDYLLELGGVEGETQDDKHKNQIEILSYSWGATRADALTDGLLIVRGVNAQPAAGASKDMTLKGSKIGENSTATAGGVRVAVGDVDGDGRAEASGQATGKRMHKPLRLSAPLATGSVTMRGKFPGCMVGARYPTMRLGNAARRYTLQDAVITSCATVRGGAAPMEEVSFNYAKIKT